MSDFDRMAAAFASPLFTQQFGERDANGAYGGVKYWPPAAPDGSEGIPWVASVGSLDLDEAQDDGSGTHQEQEIKEVVVLRGESPATPFLKNGRFEIARYAGERFSIESINAGAVMTTVRVYRYQSEAKQRRGVERGR